MYIFPLSAVFRDARETIRGYSRQIRYIYFRNWRASDSSGNFINNSHDLIETVMMFSQPLWWEYIWCVSLLLSFLGLTAIKENRVLLMKQYIAGLIVFGFVPLFYAIIYYFGDVWTYLVPDDDDDLDDILMWQVFILWSLTKVLSILFYFYYF